VGGKGWGFQGGLKDYPRSSVREPRCGKRVGKILEGDKRVGAMGERKTHKRSNLIETGDKVVSRVVVVVIEGK